MAEQDDVFKIKPKIRGADVAASRVEGAWSVESGEATVDREDGRRVARAVDGNGATGETGKRGNAAPLQPHLKPLHG